MNICKNNETGEELIRYQSLTFYEDKKGEFYEVDTWEAARIFKTWNDVDFTTIDLNTNPA